MRKILQSLGLFDDSSQEPSPCDKKKDTKPTITFEYNLDERPCVGKDFQRGNENAYKRERVTQRRMC